MRLFQIKKLGQWFPRKQIEECRMKPTKPKKSCPPPHPGRPIIVGKPHKQKSRVDGAYNAHECVYKCMWILNSVSIGMGSSVYMCISVCVCVCAYVCVYLTAQMRTGCRQLLCSRPHSFPSRCISPQPTCHP